MTRQFLLLIIILLASCQSNSQSDSKSDSKETHQVLNDEKGITNALSFLNGYIKECYKPENATSVEDWVNENRLSTKHFKSEFIKMMDSAYKADSDMGPDADLILNAQDFPNKGFELDSFDSKNNYVILKGKDWPEFKVTLKMVNENGKLLVDGCGVVNIPEERQGK